MGKSVPKARSADWINEVSRRIRRERNFGKKKW